MTTILCETSNRVCVEHFATHTPEGLASFIERVKVLTFYEVPFKVTHAE